jgi:hypothetical protein
MEYQLNELRQDEVTTKWSRKHQTQYIWNIIKYMKHQMKSAPYEHESDKEHESVFE